MASLLHWCAISIYRLQLHEDILLFRNKFSTLGMFEQKHHDAITRHARDLRFCNTILPLFESRFGGIVVQLLYPTTGG